VRIAVFVGERAAFLVNAAVDHAAQMLGEVAEEVRVDVADGAIESILMRAAGACGKQGGGTARQNAG